MSSSYRFPTVIVALGLIALAITDATVAIVNWQVTDLLKSTGLNLSSMTSTIGTTGNTGWLIDLGAAGISMAVATLLLFRPDRLALSLVGGWSAIAFLANFFGRKSMTIDGYSIYRCPVYFLALVAVGVLLLIQYSAAQAETAKAAPAVPAAPPAPPAA